MSCNTIMSAPVCLIETDVNGLFCVRKEAKNILDGIKEPVVVVSVVGLYRTGKSYLMNRLAGQQSGFALGKTIESKTKGIWMWCVPHPTKPRHTLVLLDTEGLGDVDKGDEQHDTWIFCLALLLSSTLVYNSLGVIDNMALEKLHYVTELREHMLIKAGSWDEDGQNKSVFPAFVWTIRDFYLDLEKDNKPITADQYLEGALELKEGDSNNLARRCLRNFFVTRKCFVFPRPASPKDMKRMEVLTEAELDPEFLEQSKDFCKYIYHSAQSKTIAEGCVVTGKVLANLTEVYVEAIRSGSVPCLENAVISLSKIHNAQAVDEALQIYVKEIHKSLQLPVDSKQQSTFHKTFEKKAIEVFICMSFNDTEQNYLKQLEKDIEAQYQAACVQNMEASRKVCQTILHDVFAPLEKSLRYNSYMKSGGYQEYRNTLTQLTRTYTSKAQMNMMSGEVLNNYLREKTQTEELVLQTDRNLTQALRQKEEERQRRLILEQKQREIETQRQRHQQMLVEKQRAHDEYMRQLEETRRREQKRIAEENQRIMEARLREQERMLQNSYQQETASLQR